VRGERMREVTHHCRVKSINGDSSSKSKRKRHRRGETGGAATQLCLPMVRQRLEGRAVWQRWPNGWRWCAIKRRPVTEEEATGRGAIVGREEDEAAWLGWATRTEEGSAVAAAGGRGRGSGPSWAERPGGLAGPLGLEG
jgi:hypothetical protein